MVGNFAPTLDGSPKLIKWKKKEKENGWRKALRKLWCDRS